MRMLITENELEKLKWKDLVPLECEICHNTFYKTKGLVRRGLKGTRRVSVCGNNCRKKAIGQALFGGYIELICEQCGKKFNRKQAAYNTQNIYRNKKCFCSRKCVSIWIAKNGDTTRSKLERWIEEQLTILYPALIIKYNDRETLNGLELDIFIPSLSLAFELNGIYHYEPIYGEEKLAVRKGFDKVKFQDCIAKNIALCVIDISKVKRLKPERDKIYVDIISNLIEEKLERMEGFARLTDKLVACHASHNTTSA